MAYYKTCWLCGATLDPGECCDCQDKEKTAPVLEHRDGQAESELLHPQSASIVQRNKGGNQV